MIEHNGKMYARVSEVLTSFSDYSHIDPKVLANKARIGTEVHQAISDCLNDEFPILGKDCKGYFESFLCWKDSFRQIFHRSEERFFDDELMICGQIDALCLYPEFKMPCLVDFKTSVRENYEVWQMQAHLYIYLLEKNGVGNEGFAQFVKLNRYGNKPDVFTYPYLQSVMDKCIESVKIFWDKNK